jgi:hypothetical protein
LKIIEELLECHKYCTAHFLTFVSVPWQPEMGHVPL